MEARINFKPTALLPIGYVKGGTKRPGGGAAADAILDCITNSSCIIPQYGDSLRENRSLTNK